MAQLVIKRYATALFDIAKEKEAIDAFEEQVKTIYEIIKQQPEFISLLDHKRISHEEKIKLLETTFEGRVNNELVGLLILLVTKKRQIYILDILQEFLRLVKEAKGQVKATLTSAIPLSNEQLAQIKAKLEKSTQKTIELETVIDKSIIGGMIIRVGDKVVDSSIKGKLNGLKSQLSNLRLA